MKIKKLLALVLAAAMVLSILPAASASSFARINTWNDGAFSDVPSDEWFASNVKDAFELGLMKGAGAGKFNPKGNLSLAETITVAARIHSLATTGEEKFEQGNPWYQVYADYALANGIIVSVPANITSNATRLQFAEILAKAMSDEDLSAINTVDNGIIPDVASNEAVYKLYRAGVLTGGDEKGTFSPANSISRAEVSAIVARMALPETRIKRDLKKAAVKEENKSTPNVGSMAGGSSASKPQKPAKSEISADVELDESGKTKNEVSMSGEKVNATVPAGVAVNEGAEKLVLKVEAMEETGGNIELDEDETLSSYDVHIDGVSAENTVAIKVFLGDILPTGMNLGNITLYHIENEETNAMTQVATLDELDEHNEFYYDPATGDVTVALASFSEIAVRASATKWEGKRDYTWYSANATNFTIANADQLAGLSAIVGGMDGQTADSFKGKTVKMVCDIDINDLDDSENGIVFYPVGYYNNEGTYEKTGTSINSGFRKFEGTFDGNGHKISNFYQNTWEMKGDHNWYDPGEQRYRDGMGIFGKVYGGTVKNLTVDNFSSDGEITTTGVIASYADCGATFENISIFNCNPRVYNIGNGGIVGCVGWYANDAHTTPVTFRNITVDNTNKVSALWGSWDVACGGIVGQYYPTSGQENAVKNGGIHMENCHVAAQIDVYNDVCANYQYYAYRYAGILIGSVRENVTVDGHEYPKMDGITASGCTVHFGDWNDYYYCELVANSLASYTHDHQMSRLEQVLSVDSENMKVTKLDGKTYDIPTSGAANYVVVKEKDTDGKWEHGDGHDFAECYHFVDGNVWNHEDAGKETVDGAEVLKEDKQLVYREFNNLVTGYGWGVTSKGVGDMAGVTILDRDDAGSVSKFAGKGVVEIESNTAIKLSDLFDAVDNGVELKLEGLNVTVGDLNEADGIATGTFNKAATWEDSTITVSGKGAITITIQDYYFCDPTTIRLTAIDPMMSLDIDATMLYAVGQELNINSVTVNYAYGGSKVLNADEYTVSDVDMSFGGKKIVTVTYTELGKTFSTSITVTVSDSFNSLIATPDKNVYNVGENVQLTVTAIATDGTRAEVTGYNVSGYNADVVGAQTVTVTYANKTTTCIVKVVNTATSNHKQYWFDPFQFYLGDSTSHNYKQYTPDGKDAFPDRTNYPYLGEYVGANGEKAADFFNHFGECVHKSMDSSVDSPSEWYTTMGAGQYGLTITEALPWTTVGAGFITGYDAHVVGVGYYIDGNVETLEYSAPDYFKELVKTDPNYQGFINQYGTEGIVAKTKFKLSDFAAGSTHTITWVVVFEDGIQKITDWTVTMKSSFGSDEYFKDTDKPNINVVVLSGQSNAAGATPITQAEMDKWGNMNFQNVYMQYKNVYTTDGVNVYTQNENEGFEKYYFGMGGYYETTFGPDAALAYHLVTDPECKDEQWFIIKYTAPGTNLDLHWQQNAKLSQKMMDYVQNCIDELSKSYDVQVRSFLWMQGENDALAESCANNYAANEQNLVTAFRNKFAKYASRPNGSIPGSGIAFINGGIAPAGKDGNEWTYSATVNAAKVNNAAVWYVPGTVTEQSPVFGFVSAGGMHMNPNGGAIYNSCFIDTSLMSAQATDPAHYDQQSMDWLGTWFGQYVAAMITLFN